MKWIKLKQRNLPAYFYMVGKLTPSGRITKIITYTVKEMKANIPNHADYLGYSSRAGEDIIVYDYGAKWAFAKDTKLI